MLGAALKTNPSLKFAVLTGCLRIARESIFTGLNNFRCYGISDVQYADKFGFTSDEVDEMLAKAGLTNKKEEIQKWYDGYHFGNGDEIYCPWDVLLYVDDLQRNASANPYSPSDYIKKNLPSVLRNELIAKTLYVGKRIEEFGSGLKRVNALCRDAGIRYSFENSELGFKAVIYRSQPIDVTLNVPINVTLNGTEMSILALLKTNPDMTRDELAERVSKTVRTVQRSIDSLKKKGIIERSGSKKTGSWIFKK
ncbi:MAG: AAA family ATPase [Mailhella sp.]|nr:AAA family ATPase [Mailhella sp.]